MLKADASPREGKKIPAPSFIEQPTENLQTMHSGEAADSLMMVSFIIRVKEEEKQRYGRREGQEAEETTSYTCGL